MKQKKIQRKIITLIGITFILAFTTNSGVNALNSNSIEATPLYIKASLTENPIIGTPSIDPTEPGSFDDATISCSISDSDSIQNATLFWNYKTINGTFFSTAMSGGQTLIVDETNFQRTGFITDGGVETDSQTYRRFGDYIYTVTEGETISEIDLSVVAPGLGILIYIRIDAINITSGEWELRDLHGSFGGTTEVDPYPATYTSSELVSGYRIYAVTYKDTFPPPASDPEFDHLYIYQEVYEGIIPSSNQPTWVDYYINAFDTLNNSATSATSTILMDEKPVVTLYDLPTVIEADTDLILNVSVSDLDGVSTIDDSSVVAYYRLDYETEWNQVSLVHLLDFADTAFYNGSISSLNLINEETTLLLKINASDIVEGQKGREGSTGILSTIIDSLNPRVNSISIDGGVSVPGLENTTLVSSQVNITAEFTDASGIELVYIYYAIPDGSTYVKAIMTNMTDISVSVSTSKFTILLPAANETANVSYYFETSDYKGNSGFSSVNYYYADGAAPILEALLVYPPYISDLTEVTVLFNAADPSYLMQSVLWYSFDAGSSWDNVVAIKINYNDPSLIDYQETFVADNTPIIIADNSTTYLPFNIQRGGGVSQANLSIDINHENPNDLRLWLLTQDGKRFLIFDRETYPTTFTLNIDLIALGLKESDFTNGTFTLEIADYSDLYSGSVTNLEVKLIHHIIPLGYQYMAVIPQTNNDSDVSFYITLMDSLSNDIDTSTYLYHSDGLPPEITVQTIESPIELSGSHTVQVSAYVTDAVGVSGSEVYYKLADSEEWSVLAMELVDPATGYFVGEVPIFTNSGNLTYYIRAFDFVGHSNTSEVFAIEYIDGYAPLIVIDELLTLNLEKERTFRIQANITDDGTVVNVTIYYKFSEEGNWKIKSMKLDTEENLYYYDVTVPTKKGSVFFKILAIDDHNLTSETEMFLVNFENAALNPLKVVIPVATIAVVGTSVITIIARKKGGLRKLFRRGI